MMKKIFVILLTSMVTSPAWAGSSTVNYNSTGATPFATTTDGSSNNYSRQTIWDQAAAANGLTVNSAHALLADPGTAASWNTTWAGGTLGAMANYGTSPGAVLVPGVNAFITNSPPAAVNITPADCSGTISVGGTAQNAITSSATLHGFFLANIDASAGSGEPLWISFTTTAAAATAASYALAAPTAVTFAGMSSFTTPTGFATNHAVSVVGATAGHKFSCTQW